MKASIQTLIIFAILTFSVNKVFCQWTEIPGPYGPNISNLIPHNGKVFATSIKDSIVKFIRTDDLLNWNLVSEFKINTNTQLLSIYEDGVFYNFAKGGSPVIANYSLDEGLSWKQVDFSLLPGIPLFFVPINKTIIVFTNNKIYSTTNFGKSWLLIKNTSAENIIGAAKLMSGKLLFCTPLHYFISDDLGNTWTSDTAFYPKKLGTVAIFSNSKGIFISGVDIDEPRLFYSENEGISWKSLQSPLVDLFDNVYDLAVNSEGIWAKSQFLWLSKDNGKSWEYFNVPYFAHSFTLTNDTLFMAGQGFYKSFNSANTWISGNLGLDKINSINDYKLLFRPKPSTFDYYNGRLYLSTRNNICTSDVEGKEWIFYNVGDIWIQDFIGNKEIAGFFGKHSLIITDNGANWQEITKLPQYPFNYSANTRYTDAGKYLFAIYKGPSNLYRSENNGASWDTLPGLFEFGYNVSLKSVEDKIYIAEKGKVLVSEDFGDSFQLANAGLENEFADTLWSSQTDLFTKIKNKFYQLKNNVWEETGIGLKDSNGKLPEIYKIIGNNNFQAMSCTYDSNTVHFMHSTDGGFNWQSNLNSDLPDLKGSLCTNDNKYIYVAGVEGQSADKGLLRIFKTEYTTATHSIENIKDIIIAPNPSNSQIMIRNLILDNYDITIVDLLGKTVLKTHSNNMDVNIDITSIPIGTYVVLVQTKSQHLSKKLIIMR